MTELASVATLTLKSLDEGLRLCVSEHRAGRLADPYSCCDQKQREACQKTLREITRFMVNLLEPGCNSETYLDSTGREVAAFAPSDKCCSLIRAKWEWR